MPFPRSRFGGYALAAAMSTCAVSAVVLATSPSPLPPANPQPSSTAPAGAPVVGFMVSYRAGSATRASAGGVQRSIDAIAANAFAGGKRIGLRHLRTMSLGNGVEVIRAERSLSADEAATLLKRIQADPQVESVQLDRMARTDAIPNDEFFFLQGHLQGGPGGIRATEAWDVIAAGTNNLGQNQIVAVVDTGILFGHPDLNGRTLPGYDFISNAFVANDGQTSGGSERDPDASDPGDGYDAGFCGAGVPAFNSNWHGSHTAGIIAASFNNRAGIAGLAGFARIQPIRALGRCGGIESDIIDGMLWAGGIAVPGVPANPTPAHVINMSLGLFGNCSASPIWQNAINAVRNRGVTIVVSAGNNAADASVKIPAGCPGVITVAATDANGASATGFTNYGTAVDLAAPGVQIPSLSDFGNRGPTGFAYRFLTGTSEAAPHVAGVIALMQSKRTQNGRTRLPPGQVESIVKGSVKPFGVAPAANRPIGTGILDARAAVDATPL